MRSPALFVLVGIGAATLGFWAGRATAAPQPEPKADPPAAVTRSPSRATRRTAQGLVCAAIGGGRQTTPEPSCDGLALQAKWCQAQLEQCEGQRKAVRQPWPQADTAEAPDQWADAVEEALAQCDMGAELELVECSEYPCVAALRPSDPTLDAAGREREMKRMMAVARGCAPLRESFGITPEHEAALDVYRLDARCGDGRESFFVLSALSPQGPAYALQSTENRDAQQERDFSRWLYRRADDVSGLWPCAQ